MAPLTLAPLPFAVSEPNGIRAGRPTRPGMSVGRAGPLGGDADVLDAVLEALGHSERNADSRTRIVLVIPGRETPAKPQLARHLERFRVAGWRDATVVPLPATDADCAQAVLKEAADDHTLLVPLAITPGPFSSRVNACGEQLGIPAAAVSLHASSSLIRLLGRRVVEARRR